MKDYMENWKEHRDAINQYNRAYREFIRLRKQVKNWLSIIGLIEVENENAILTGYSETDDFDDQKPPEFDEPNESDEDIDIEQTNSVQKQINEILKIIDENDFENLEVKGFSSDGVFCLIDDKICRADVLAYRNGTGW